MVESQKNYIEWKKPDLDEFILMITFIWGSRTVKTTEIEIRIVIALGKWGLTGKGQEGTLWVWKCFISWLDGGYMSVYICQNSSNYTLKIYACYLYAST